MALNKTNFKFKEKTNFFKLKQLEKIQIVFSVIHSWQLASVKESESG